MARSYRKVNDALREVRRALGAVAAADGEDGRGYAFACGYAQDCLERALRYLDGYGNQEGDDGFVTGYSDYQRYTQPQLPFEV